MVEERGVFMSLWSVVKELFDPHLPLDIIGPEFDFEEIKECPKCGGRSFIRSYRAPDFDVYMNVETREHISLLCVHCHWRGREKPKDAA